MIPLLLLLLADTSRRPEPDWYPLDPGMSWTYSDRGRRITRTICGYKEVAGRRCVEVRIQYPGGVEYTHFVARDDSAYLIFASASKGRNVDVFSEPIPILALPLSPGKKWVRDANRSSVEGEEMVEAIGRKYRATKVTTTFPSGSESVWYVRGIGVVKYLREGEGCRGSSKEEGILVEFRRS